MIAAVVVDDVIVVGVVGVVGGDAVVALCYFAERKCRHGNEADRR